MSGLRTRLVLTIVPALILWTAGSAWPIAVDPSVLSPARLGVASGTTTVTITFDVPVDRTSITASSFRVFGKQSGTATGPFTFSNLDKSVTLTPSHPFVAGEVVHVNLSHDVRGADTSSLRSAGFTYQFRIATAPSSHTFTRIQSFSNRDNPNVNTHLYGAMAGDLNGDGFVDLTTVNEDAADLRVTLNRADGTGTFGSFLTPFQHIGVESSPNESCDIDNDGKMDIAVSSTDNGSVFVVRGNGDGTWASAQEVPLGTSPETHGVAVADIDGDGDWDVINANHAASNLAVMINTNGVLGMPTFIESGVDGEYALNSGDMNNDGISDLVVGGQDSQQIIVLLGNGDGTFTPQTPQSAGGLVWKLVLGDVNGDGKLDVAAVNGDSDSAAILLGNGDGTLQPPTVFPTSGTEVGTVLGDLDGDGDLDWVTSSFSGQQWHVFINDGAGNFTLDSDIDAEPDANPSCAIMLDVDNDGDLDLALTDETSDHTRIYRNDSGSTPDCPPAPDVCRPPTKSGASSLLLRQQAVPDDNKMLWKWTKGSATAKTDFGAPLTTDRFTLCMYDAGVLVSTSPVSGSCTTKPCWFDKPNGFLFKNKSLQPSGVKSLKLVAGGDGKASEIFKGKGASLALPDPTSLVGPIDVQLHTTAGTLCWGARFSAPFQTDAGGLLKDKSD
jgi:hypothetical protein